MQRRPALARSVLVALAAAMAWACSRPSPESAPRGDAHGDAPSASARDLSGPARRIVSLAPSYTETLLALGAADAVVGIGAFDPPIPGRPDVPRLGDASTVSVEALVALRPDLVLANSTVLAEKLAPVAARTRVVVETADTLAGSLAMVTRIGALTGREREAAVLVASIRASLDAARERAAERTRSGVRAPRVLVVVQRRPLYVAGRASFVAELLRAIGAENATDDLAEPWPTLSEEAAVARAPDVILDASEGDNATEEGRAALLATWRRFPSIPAVREGRVRVIREDSIFRAGPRVPEALAKLEALVFGAEGTK